MRDIRNRFKHWSAAPRTGEISLPFSFPIDAENWELYIDHQLFGNFNPKGFKSLNLDGDYYDFSVTERRFTLNNEQLSDQSINVTSNVAIPYTSIKYAIQNVVFDQSAGMVSGELKLAMSINEVYTAEIFTNYELP